MTKNLMTNVSIIQKSSVWKKLKLQWRLFLNAKLIFGSSRPEVFCKKAVPRNFPKFTGKHLCQSPCFNKIACLSPATLLKKRLWRRCFPVNFAKFLRAPFLTEHLWWLLPNIRYLLSTERFRISMFPKVDLLPPVVLAHKCFTFDLSKNFEVFISLFEVKMS